MKKLWSYKKLADGTLSVTGYKGSEENIVIPPRIGNDPVTAIDEMAFSPDKPRTVKNQKLFLKTRLRSVTLPDSITSVGDFAFYGCEQLECVNFTQKRILFGDKVFSGCNKLSDKNGFVIVGDVLWSYYGRDKEIIIPEGVTAIGTEAFYRNCYIKELIIPESVAFIGQGAFRGCSAMKKLVIPQSVKCVDNKAFYGCYKLGDSDGFLIINNVLYGYYGKSTKITIPEGATVIGEDSFYNRIMDNVTVPEGVISIGRYAFQNANIGSVTLPQSVTSIGERAFGWGSTSLVVKAGSYAEQYAKENNIPFVAEE